MSSIVDEDDNRYIVQLIDELKDVVKDDWDFDDDDVLKARMSKHMLLEAIGYTQEHCAFQSPDEEDDFPVTLMTYRNGDLDMTISTSQGKVTKVLDTKNKQWRSIFDLIVLATYLTE